MKVSGGYAVVYDATSPRTFTRHMDQYSWSTYFTRDGAIERGPALTLFTIANERRATPFSRNWNLSVQQRLPWDVYARYVYLRRRSNHGFTFRNRSRDTAPPELFSDYEVDALYDLSNFRRDSYTSHDFTVRKAFRGEHMLMASYIRSRAMSNAVADINIDDPVSYSETFGPMPWDTPNRLMTWATAAAAKELGVCLPPRMARWLSFLGSRR